VTACQTPFCFLVILFSAKSALNIEALLRMKRGRKMNLANLVLLVMTLAIGFLQSGCTVENFAESSQPSANRTAEKNRNTEIAFAKAGVFEKDSENSAIIPNPSATPKSESKPKPDNFVCPEPELSCNHSQKEFGDWELSFRLPKKIVANKTYKSAPFYAIILKVYSEGCSELDVDMNVEAERIDLQKKFPSRKVFAENSCANLSAVGYEFDGKMDKTGERILISDYIAVYGGVTEDEAAQILDLIEKDFPKAQLKKMVAVYKRTEM
jgi:hypothetical protein